MVGTHMLRKGAHQDTRLVSPHLIGIARPHMHSLHYTGGSRQRSFTLWMAVLIRLLLAVFCRPRREQS